MRSLCLLVALAGSIFGQSAPDPKLYFTAGKIVGQGTNTTADGSYRLKSYRIEEVALPAGKAYRVIVTAESFPVRAIPPMIWLDDVLIGRGQESADLKEVVAVTLNPALIRNGAKIGFAFGENGKRETLREAIRLNGGAQ